MWKKITLIQSTIIILLILLIVWHNNQLVNYNDIFLIIPQRRLLMSKNINNIKSGDIIYTAGSSLPTIQGFLIPYFYKHIAIVIKINNKLYIADTSLDKSIGRIGSNLIKRRRGVDIYPLDYKLKNSLGSAFISRLNKPLTNEQNYNLIQTLTNHCNDLYPNVFQLYITGMLNLSIKNIIYCHTLIYNCLVNTNLTKQKKMTLRQLGDFITTLPNRELNDGYKYENVMQLIYDYECNDEPF